MTMTVEERVETYIRALERTTRDLGYTTVSISTLNLVISRFIEKHNPPPNASDRLVIESLDRDKLRSHFEKSLKESLKPQPKVDAPIPEYSGNVVPLRRKK